MSQFLLDSCNKFLFSSKTLKTQRQLAQFIRNNSTDKGFSITVEEFELPKTDFENLVNISDDCTHPVSQKLVIRKNDKIAAKNQKMCDKTLDILIKKQKFPKLNCNKTSVGLNQPRKNALNVQMISQSIYNQLYKNCGQGVNEEVIEKCKTELIKFGLMQENPMLPETNFELPPLEGENIEEHFRNIGEKQAQSYRKLLLDLIEAGIPMKPPKWLMVKGWTMYAPGKDPVSVPCPLEDALVFDVEVCMRVGKAPTLATAVSAKAWYGWVCSELGDDIEPVAKQSYTTQDFIPFESKDISKLTSRVVVGHNVSYDRARIKEQYFLDNSALRFVDTMALHVCVGGVTSYQRLMLKSKTIPVDEDDSWREYTSLNSLKEVYKLYCKSELSKEERNVFVEGTFSDIRQRFQVLMLYCAGDVEATYKVLQKLFPLFLNRFPHPVTFAGMLEMGTAYLPVNQNWNSYITDAQQTYDDLENEAKFILARKSDNACQLLHNEKYKQDLWMWDEDWSTQELKINKKKKANVPSLDSSLNVENELENDGLEEKYRDLFESCINLPARIPLLPGYPAWYRKLCDKPNTPDWVPGPQSISTGVKVTPKLLNLTWEGYPLHHTREKGWGFLVANLNITENIETAIPYRELKQLTLSKKSDISDSESYQLDRIQVSVNAEVSKKDYWDAVPTKKISSKQYVGSGVWSDHVVDSCCYFLKLPHKNGSGNNVGNPLSKDFLKTFTTSVLSGSDVGAQKILSIGRMLSYWRNNKERIAGQLPVWLSKKELPKVMLQKEVAEGTYGAILPQMLVCGTLTRRAMEPTWMTASNALGERIGSELRAIVQSPPGFSFVGADVDSQELWIASMIGDANFAKIHGATPFGWMTLSGQKANGTDLHSVTAKAAGISRDHAKVINYARIYGAGQRFAQKLLKQFNPLMADTEAKAKANKMFLVTKGKKMFKIRPQFKDLVEQIPEEYYSSFSALKVAKQLGKSVEEVFERGKWVGGSESAMFNRLEEIACCSKPVTPFLGGRLSRALEPRSSGDDSYLTTKINWVVQSGAVDFLHLMLVCMKWLTNGQARFCISFHDEVRYLVTNDKKYNTALALHVTNLLTRVFCSHRLGLYDLPQSVAFFSSVDVDTVLRKEANQECITPSNPHGMTKGYGVLPGESLSIYEAIKKSNGNLEVFRKPKQVHQSCVQI